MRTTRPSNGPDQTFCPPVSALPTIKFEDFNGGSPAGLTWKVPKMSASNGLTPFTNPRHFATRLDFELSYNYRKLGCLLDPSFPHHGIPNFAASKDAKTCELHCPLTAVT